MMETCQFCGGTCPEVKEYGHLWHVVQNACTDYMRYRMWLDDPQRDSETGELI